MSSSLDGADEFRAMYEGEFRMRDPNEPLWKLAEEYYTRCDAYDDSVCTGRSKWGSMPASDYERRLITKHALEVLKDVRQRAEMDGFSFEALRDAMREYSKNADRRR